MNQINEKNMKAKTIDELCGDQPGAFRKFVSDKEAYLEALDNERKARIKASQQATWDLSVAA